MKKGFVIKVFMEEFYFKCWNIRKKKPQFTSLSNAKIFEEKDRAEIMATTLMRKSKKVLVVIPVI